MRKKCHTEQIYFDRSKRTGHDFQEHSFWFPLICLGIRHSTCPNEQIALTVFWLFVCFFLSPVVCDYVECTMISCVCVCAFVSHWLLCDCDMRCRLLHITRGRRETKNIPKETTCVDAISSLVTIWHWQKLNSRHWWHHFLFESSYDYDWRGIFQLVNESSESNIYHKRKHTHTHAHAHMYREANNNLWTTTRAPNAIKTCAFSYCFRRFACVRVVFFFIVLTFGN